VKRLRAALVASILAIGTLLIAGSCSNPLNGYLRAMSTLNMVYVDGGTLTLGSNFVQDNEGPLHDVTVSTFLMSPYEVPQALYEEVMGVNPSHYPWGPSMPVEMVSWLDAVKFCNALSARDSLMPCYTIVNELVPIVSLDTAKDGYRLPTEAEWEFAARGGIYGYGYTYAGSNYADDVAWHDTNSGGTPHPVGELQPNEIGLYDMSGNVMEWCWDGYDYESRDGGATYHAFYYLWLETQYPPVLDPLGPNDYYYDAAGAYSTVVLRGGSYNSSDWTRVSARTGDYNDGTYWDVGFRVVRRP
jgi:formylglycine-generating enzyme required for sulfatase activity